MNREFLIFFLSISSSLLFGMDKQILPSNELQKLKETFMSFSQAQVTWDNQESPSNSLPSFKTQLCPVSPLSPSKLYILSHLAKLVEKNPNKTLEQLYSQSVTYYCPECGQRGFTDKALIKQHLESAHHHKVHNIVEKDHNIAAVYINRKKIPKQTTDRQPCPFPGCKRTYAQKQSIYRHVRINHPDWEYSFLYGKLF